MKQKIITLAILAIGGSIACAATSNIPESTLVSGINRTNRDLSVRPQDDFYQYSNGLWLKNTRIPADKSSWGAFNELRQTTLEQLHNLIESQIKGEHSQANSSVVKIATIYQQFMNESQLNQQGITPLEPLLKKVAQLTSVQQIPALMAQLQRDEIAMPYSVAIHQDAKDSSVMVADFYQDGLGLPDRDYYLKKDDHQLAKTLNAYQIHVAKMLAFINDSAPQVHAKEIIQLETKLATAQWTKVANRDPQKTYNKYLLSQLDTLTPGYPWPTYLTASGIKGKVNYVIISQPSYFQQFNHLLKHTPLAVWQTYLRLRIIDHFAPDLSQPLVNENFAFYGSALSGIPQNKPRWQRGIALVEGTLGNALGKLYVEQYFPPQNRAKVQTLVANLMAAYSMSIESLDWMSPATKAKAQEKLAAIMLKIGYPDQWRDYSGLNLTAGNLIDNLIAANRFNYDYEINKLGKPVDRSEWGMTPQTVNAYYNPELNEIVFPAAILQPPFFDVDADMAANYGGIGAVIGHEISHGFDDQGSQYDANGNLHDWFTKEDHQRFDQKTAALVAQYNAYSPLPGYHVNGELTLGENIADNSGLAIAYKAYLLSLHGESAPIIDGYSGSQRFYLSWANVWRAKVRPEQQIIYLKSDPHSPAAVRGNAPLKNQPGFYSAFTVKESDRMYLPPQQRITIW